MHKEVSRLLRRVLLSPSAETKRALLEDQTYYFDDFGRYLFAHINIYLAEGNPRAARKLLKTATALRPLYRPLGINYDYFLLKARARISHAEGKVEQSIQAFRQLLRLLSRVEQQPLQQARAEVAMELGLLFDELGDRSQAERYFRLAYREAVATEGVFNQGAALFNLAALCLDQGREPEFETHCGQVVRLSRQHSLVPHLARALLLMANQWDYRHQAQQARRYYLEALTTYWKLPDMVKVTEILTRAGELAATLGETSEQLLALYEALQISRKIDFLQGLARWTYWAGMLCRDAGLERRAQVVFEGCNQMAASLGMEMEKVSGALRAHQCLGEHPQEPLYAWLERQAPPIGTPAAEGIDATGMPLTQYLWSPTVAAERASYGSAGGDGCSLAPFQHEVPRPPLIARARILYLLLKLAAADTAFFSLSQKDRLYREARDVDRHVRKNGDRPKPTRDG